MDAPPPRTLALATRLRRGAHPHPSGCRRRLTRPARPRPATRPAHHDGRSRLPQTPPNTTPGRASARRPSPTQPRSSPNHKPTPQNTPQPVASHTPRWIQAERVGADAGAEHVEAVEGRLLAD